MDRELAWFGVGMRKGNWVQVIVRMLGRAAGG